MTETTEFKPGDVVRLKSGGPAMTVAPPHQVDHPGSVRVLRFAGDSAVMADIIPAVCLEHVRPFPGVLHGCKDAVPVRVVEGME